MAGRVERGATLPPMLTEVQEWTPEVEGLLTRAMFPDPKRIRLRLEEYLTDPSRRVFVWEVAGQPVSAAGIRQTGEEVELLHLGTAPEHEGRGYAHALLHALLAGLNATRLTAETDDSAVDFYRRSGFKVENAPPRSGQPRYRVALTRP